LVSIATHCTDLCYGSHGSPRLNITRPRQIIARYGQETGGLAPRPKYRRRLPWMSLLCTGRLRSFQFQLGKCSVLWKYGGCFVRRKCQPHCMLDGWVPGWPGPDLRDDKRRRVIVLSTGIFTIGMANHKQVILVATTTPVTTGYLCLRHNYQLAICPAIGVLLNGPPDNNPPW
jgi:hypothetical protein